MDKPSDMYFEDGEPIPVDQHVGLGNMRSVMHKQVDDNKVANDARKDVDRLGKSLNNLLRENQTLRKRGAMLDDKNRKLESRMGELEREVSMLVRAMTEVTNILDKYEKDGIIVKNRRN